MLSWLNVFIVKTTSWLCFCLCVWVESVSVLYLSFILNWLGGFPSVPSSMPWSDYDPHSQRLCFFWVGSVLEYGGAVAAMAPHSWKVLGSIPTWVAAVLCSSMSSELGYLVKKGLLSVRVCMIFLYWHTWIPIETHAEDCPLTNANVKKMVPGPWRSMPCLCWRSTTPGLTEKKRTCQDGTNAEDKFHSAWQIKREFVHPYLEIKKFIYFVKL